ncbi:MULTISPECIES: AAA family ATPase [unclassified Pantoea]|uniref:AAA family ATPase n=1 Tax=unclassified Pantoea TaxID=2630326 RepID=UPI0024774346|nr:MULTISPECIES: AAA family ATPase [unclassified Pantoea]GME47339.1 DUF3696 domain-containing protein [Pantoea sp. QMID3]GME47366.1 DUF3696 domain-containing protein [Pantoea sp. QMID1]GME62286.1 DUF3696 domain-containing protein [Pantoea sp. QMID4]GME63600.1 DUF3696 domain-containing protein [Pantoea sp. QMID2]
MLTKIEILNFKSLESETLSLKPLTIFTGANSSGKSSVLQAIMLVIKQSQESNRYSMEELLRYLNDFHAIRNKKTNAKAIKISVTDSQNTVNELTIFVDGFIRKSDLSYIYEPSEEISSQPEFLYLNANRIGAQEVTPLSDRRIGILGEYLFSTFEKIKIKPVEEQLLKFPGSKTLSYQVAEWLSYITGTTSELVTEKISDQLKISFKIREIEGFVSPFNLGAGMSYISKVIIICLMAKKGDLIIIENPEVQLHPKAQSYLGEFLCFIAANGIQLIVETHCEHLLNKVTYQVYKDSIQNEDVIIHYKPDVNSKFLNLLLNEDGEYVDCNNNTIAFPKGFFDATLSELLEMR